MGLTYGADDAQHQAAGASASVEGLIAGDRQDPEADPLGLQPCHDRQQVARRPGTPIEARDDDLIALADEIERGLKLLALSYRGNLLPKHPLAPGRLKVANLSLQPGHLRQGRRSGIAYRYV